MAAGLGTRMKSNRAKVLHELGGLALITHVSRAAQSLSPKSIVVVVGHQAEEVEKVVQDDIGDLGRFAVQAQQRGTGDAVESARGLLENSDSLLVLLSGDVPMIRAETLQKTRRAPPINKLRLFDSDRTPGESDWLWPGNSKRAELFCPHCRAKGRQ